MNFENNKELLTQKEMDSLLSAISIGEGFADTENSDMETFSHIKSFDFRNSDKISKRECRELSNTFEGIKNQLSDFTISKWGIKTAAIIQEVWPVEAEKYFRKVSCGCPVIAFDFLNGRGFFTMDKNLFYKGFLNSCSKENLNGLEKSIFCNQIYFPFIKLICGELSHKNAGMESVPENHRILRNASSLGKNFGSWGKGVCISICLKIGDEEGCFHLFFNGNIIESLRENNFFRCHESTGIFFMAKPEANTFAEAGRFRLEENFRMKPGMIFELNKLSGEQLEVFKDGKVVATGEGIIIDDNFGIRIFEASDEKQPSAISDDFYNAKVIFGQCHTAEDEEYWEGKILILNEYEDEKAKIVVGNKVTALGEFCVLDENTCVKITKVLDN